MAIGVGVGILAPFMVPAIRRMTGTAVNAAIRSGVMAWERGREQLAEWGEYESPIDLLRRRRLC